MSAKKLPEWFPKWNEKLKICAIVEEDELGWWTEVEVGGIFFDLSDEPFVSVGGQGFIRFDRIENCWKHQRESLRDSGIRVNVWRNGELLPALAELQLIQANQFPNKGDEVRVTLVGGKVVVETVKRSEVRRFSGEYHADLQVFRDRLDCDMGIAYFAEDGTWRFYHGRSWSDVVKVEVKSEEFWYEVTIVRPEVLG